MRLEPAVFLFLLPVAQNLLLAAALWHSSLDRAANRYLSLGLLAGACITLDLLLGQAGIFAALPRLTALPLVIGTAIGPAVYAYVKHLATGAGPARPWLHFTPAIAQILAEASGLLSPMGAHPPFSDGPLDTAFTVATLVSLAAYSRAALRVLARYRAWLATARSDDERYAAAWLRNVLMVLLVTSAAVAALQFQIWFGRSPGTPGIIAFNVWLTAVSAYVGINAWRNSERRFPKMPWPPVPVVAHPTEVPVRSHAEGRDWHALGRTWSQQILEEGWWREPDLSLVETARRLGTNTTHLSRAINEGLGFNFSELINRMRAREVARVLDGASGAQAGLLEIALEAGFSSKATFNRAFRAVHGSSPSDYRRKSGLEPGLKS